MTNIGSAAKVRMIAALATSLAVLTSAVPAHAHCDPTTDPDKTDIANVRAAVAGSCDCAGALFFLRGGSHTNDATSSNATKTGPLPPGAPRSERWKNVLLQSGRLIVRGQAAPCYHSATDPLRSRLIYESRPRLKRQCSRDGGSPCIASCQAGATKESGALGLPGFR